MNTIKYWNSMNLKDADDRRDWGKEEKGTTDYEMTGWHH